jgi:hypothetical protein
MRGSLDKVEVGESRCPELTSTACIWYTRNQTVHKAVHGMMPGASLDGTKGTAFGVHLIETAARLPLFNELVSRVPGDRQMSYLRS